MYYVVLRMHVEHQTEFLCTKPSVNAYGYKIGSSKAFHKSSKLRLLQQPQQFKKKKKPCSKTVWKSTASHVSLPDTNT